MENFEADLFENLGVKEVTKTDKDRDAFVLTSEQKAAMTAAGYEPGAGGDNAALLTVYVPTERPARQLKVSYYNSLRLDPTRQPETRMGRDIVRWMELGDQIAMGNIGGRVFAWKVGSSTLPLNELGSNIANNAGQGLLERAREVKGKPKKQDRVISDFLRNAAVVVGALSRAGGNCEMPSCTTELFQREDGSKFLEVHHIAPLAEGGDDTMANAAALCPMCHRELHYGAERGTKREILRAAIARKEV